MTVTTTEPDTEIIDMDAPNTTEKPDEATIKTLQDELTAVCAQIIAKKNEKKEFDKEIGGEIKKLEDRVEALVYEIRRGGVQLAMHFGTTRDADDYTGDDADAPDTDEDDAE